MISRTDLDRSDRSGRVLRVAIAASFALHALVLIFGIVATEAIVRTTAHPVRPKTDETVTLSSSFHIEKRARATVGAGTRAAALASASAPRIARVPPPKPLAHRPQPRPTPLPHRELAKVAPHAPATTRRPPPPASPHPTLPPQRVALAEPPAPVTAARPSRSRLTDAQLARIQRDLAKSLSADRSVAQTLSNVLKPARAASTTKRYAIDFAGANARALHGFQGLCQPIKTWSAGAYVYFYVTCKTAHDDGTIRQEALPWPIRFAARRISYTAEGPSLPPGAIPPPLPGWHPDPSQPLDPDVVRYLRKYGYSL